jgi:hypothetical protein
MALSISQSLDQQVSIRSEADVPADGTARLLDYQELTSSIVAADVR